MSHVTLKPLSHAFFGHTLLRMYWYLCVIIFIDPYYISFPVLGGLFPLCISYMQIYVYSRPFIPHTYVYNLYHSSCVSSQVFLFLLLRLLLEGSRSSVVDCLYLPSYIHNTHTNKHTYKTIFPSIHLFIHMVYDLCMYPYFLSIYLSV